MFLGRDFDKQNTLQHVQEMKAVFGKIHHCLKFESITLLNVIHSLTKLGNTVEAYDNYLSQLF